MRITYIMQDSNTTEIKINLHGYTMHQQYQMLYCPTDALNYINCRLLKTH